MPVLGRSKRAFAKASCLVLRNGPDIWVSIFTIPQTQAGPKLLPQRICCSPYQYGNCRVAALLPPCLEQLLSAWLMLDVIAKHSARLLPLLLPNSVAQGETLWYGARVGGEKCQTNQAELTQSDTA